LKGSLGRSDSTRNKLIVMDFNYPYQVISSFLAQSALRFGFLGRTTVARCGHSKRNKGSDRTVFASTLPWNRIMKKHFELYW